MSAQSNTARSRPAEQRAKPAEPEPLPTYTGLELERIEVAEWLVDGIIPAGGLVTLVGKSATYKSFIVLDLALSIVSGLPWQGRQVKRGPVLYIAAEGSYTVGARHKVWSEVRKEPNTGNCVFIVEPVNLRNEDSVAQVVASIKNCGITPVLVVIDTLARCFGGGDENSPEDMGAFIGGCDTLRQETGGAVLVIHHSGWSGGERARGHSSLFGAVDTEILVARSRLDVTLKCSKMRMAPDFESIKLHGTEHVLEGGLKSLVFDVVGASSATVGHNPWVHDDGIDPEYLKALDFAKYVASMGNGTPFASQVATKQGRDSDTVNKYAKRVERDYGLIEVVRTRDGSTPQNMLIPHLERAVI